MNPPFTTDKPGKLSGSLFFTPAFRPVFFLDQGKAVGIDKKGRDNYQHRRKDSQKDIHAGESEKGGNDPIQRTENQRARKPFDIKAGCLPF